MSARTGFIHGIGQRHLLPFLAMMLMLLCGGGSVKADENENTALYLVMQAGINQLKFEMPVYDEDDYDGWVDKGYVYVTPKGGSKQTLLYYYSKESSSTNPTAWLKKGVDGTLVLRRDENFADATITTSEKDFEIPKVPGKEYCKLYLTWTVPDAMRGKELTISWEVHKTGNMTEWSKSVTINDTKVSFPSAPELVKPEVTEPILGFDAAHAGQTMLIYTMGTNNIKSLTAHYNEVNGQHSVHKTMPLNATMSGYIYLDATKCYKDFYIEAAYTDTENNSRLTRSDSLTMPVLHAPANFTATLQADGTTQLTWNTSNAKWEDIVDGDTWDIERNSSGALNAEAKWEKVGQVTYQKNDTVYAFTDKSFLSSYEGKTVYYRLRRTSTIGWDWAAGTYAQTSLPFEVRLPVIDKAQVTRGKWTDDEHPVNFKFAFGAPEQDSEGRYLLRNAEDWERLAFIVQSTETPINIIMVADVDLSGIQTVMGMKDNAGNHYFRGTFDGNGHTLTVNYNKMTIANAAPFYSTMNATIKNLHVQGLVSSTQKNIGGLVGIAYDGTVISNCRISTKVECKGSGDVSSGGIVGDAEGNITIENTVFDGQFKGSKSSNWGGFIGVVARNKQQTIQNCLFAPSALNTLFDGCRTFARDYLNSAKITNSYYTVPFDGVSTTSINGKTFYVLRNSTDWESIRQRVASSDVDVNIVLDGSFQVSSMLGTQTAPYQGIFEGNGHTLSVNIKVENGFAAPIQYVKGTTTIRNLNVQGTVYGGKNSAGLVGSAEDGAAVTIESCRISTHITTTDYDAGGLVGHGHKAKLTINNCLFDGTLEALVYSTDSYGGAIIGWEPGGTDNIVTNCLERGTYVSINHTGFCYANGSAYGNVNNNKNNYTSHEWSEATKAGGMDAISLAQKLGGAWQTWNDLVVPVQSTRSDILIGQGTDASEMTIEKLKTSLGNSWESAGNSVLPICTVSTAPEHVSTAWDSKAKVVLYTDKLVDGEVRYTDRSELTPEEVKDGSFKRGLLTSCVDHNFRLAVEQAASQLLVSDSKSKDVQKTETGDLANYHFNNNVTITALKADTLQASVSLTWTATGSGDFYRILRYDKMEDRTDTLEANYGLTAYIDRSPRPQHIYTYTVEGVNQCEGEHISRISTPGGCRPTGMVRGYVRLADGTAMAGITVKATPKTGSIEGAGVRTAVTDETGFFEIDSLIYQAAATYEISVEMGGDMKGVEAKSASFDDYSNLVTNLNFIQPQYYLFSGQVMYEGTSVPVVGAQFERDGALLKNGSGNPIVSDSQGNFTLSIPQGSHKVRVVKEGHVFADEGYFIDPDAAGDDKSDHNWQKEKSGYIFWDKTQVTLHGRVVGGNEQGDKPLGQSASINNLGDSLTIVMQLEGDNASYLVRDQINGNITERHYRQPVGPADTCEVNIYRHRMVIHPSESTGEYLIKLPPVKFKVTEVYAQGYPTLFQAGQVGQTIDMTGCVNGDTATWNRIYHVAPSLDVRQFNATGETFMGIKSYTAMDNTGKNDTIELWDADSRLYSFGHPVFMAGSPVILTMAAVEKYYRNNDVSKAEPDIVHLPGGTVTIQNGLISNAEMKKIELDENGEAFYNFTPQNLTFTEEGDLALKTMTMTLLYDGTYYDVKPIDGKPLQGYVLAAKAKPQGRRAVSNGGTYLIDILRDPPGAGSSAYIESGTKLNYTFTQNVKAVLGLKIGFAETKGTMNYWNGVWAGEGSGEVVGKTNSVKTTDKFGFSQSTTYYNNWQYGYSFETTERISTSSGNTNVGRDADVFIGMTQTAILEDGIAVRAISEDTYNLLTTRAGGIYNVNGVDFNVKQGTMKLLAEGRDHKGNKVYLVRDEVLKFKTELQSTFAHSATYIEKELLPTLFNQRNTLLLPVGTSKETAQAVAKQNGHAMYVSKVNTDDPYFGVEGYYTQVTADGSAEADSVSSINDDIRTWVQFMAINEREKLEANELVKRFDVDGRAGVTYSETFGISENESRYLQIPFTGSGLGSLSFPTIPTGGGDAVMDGAAQKTETKAAQGGDGDDDNGKTMDFNLFHEGFTLKITPIFSVDYNYNFGMTESRSKKVGFTLAPSAKSNLVVEVYRTSVDMKDLQNRVDSMKAHGYKDPDKLFFQFVSEEYIDYVKHGAYYGKVGSLGGLVSYIDNSAKQYRSFVYRTKGGATSGPYEDERRTKYYAAGTLLDEKTIPIDNLRIWAEQTSVSNVPSDEPARFTVYMANESEVPEQTTPSFTYFLDDATNAKGAKVVIDGAPVAGEGHTVIISPGTPITKQVEIWPGDEYDYENIGICLFDAADKKRKQTVYLSAHFVPTAGKVNVSLPGNKWVINTESQYDSSQQQYYMPVLIDGFNVNHRGFDHIELQYKLSTQGDKEWVNVCSYYKDPQLFARANGVSKMIEEDGKIIAKFYGEADPVEQSYDLRAVCYCRYGGGFLTRSSEILTGVKDTRRPQLFGTPKPEDGILDIGDDIMLRFSEPIAGNYLRPLNNFQVIGQTNSSNITLSTSLRFNGGFNSASTLGERNLTGKAFTVDVMLNPENNGKPMTFFSHGYGKHQLELGLTADRRLTATFIVKEESQGRLIGETVESEEPESFKKYTYQSNQTIPFDGLRSIRYVFTPDVAKNTTTVSFYDGTKEIGASQHPLIYEGYGTYLLGLGTINGTGHSQPYVGEMLEFRLWNHALSADEMNDYGMKYLTGYEQGLLDNYPLNEGKGSYSFNRAANGSDLNISGPTWKMPDGIGMKLDGQKGFRMNGDKFTRWSHEDYTLMFWFRTTDEAGTLFGNGRSEDEAEVKDHFRFYVEGGNLQLRLGGKKLNSNASVKDGAWHHAALTVSRSRNVGCLYVDQQLRNTFTVDTIGGIQGGYLAAGATYTDPATAVDPINGHIDEIAMFEMSIPDSGIKSFTSITPTGEEMGMRAYLNFSRNEMQTSGLLRLMPTGISLKRYKDFATGEFTAQRDTIVAQDVVDQLADRSLYAPMQDTQQQENIRYSFVADGKDLLINLDVPDERIEKTNVFVVVKDVTDLNGNTMASPVMMNLYVHRNPLRWSVKRLQLKTNYGEEYTFTANIKNLSGKSQRFKLEGLPIWMSASMTEGSISALDEEIITFTVSPYINIGNFDENICLVDEDGMSEPLPITLVVRGEAPAWASVSDQLKMNGISMNVVAQVQVSGAIMNDPGDRLAVFGNNHELLGITALDADQSQISNSCLAYLTIYNSSRQATPLSYEFFDASTGNIHRLVPDPDLMYFKADTIVGTVEKPALLEANNSMVQTLHLKKGWNWISFNIWPDRVPVEELMNNATKWDIGDGLEIIKTDGTYAQLFYKSVYNPKDPKHPTPMWDNNKDTLTLVPTLMYRFYSNSDKVAYFGGFAGYENLEIKQGWNRIGYMSPINLPLGTALADYTDKASEGDVIKSQSEFSMLTVDNEGNKAWKGTLKYMHSGEGYMLKHNGSETITFAYPTYIGQSRYTDAGVKGMQPVFKNVTATSMTVVAVAEGIEAQPGDKLTAWRGAEPCGRAVADDEGVFYLNIGDADVVGTDLNFTIERDEDVIASAGGKQMRYVPNAALGAPDQPAVISFVGLDGSDSNGWYTLDGIKLPGKPRKQGVYIFNNKKAIIK